MPDSDRPTESRIIRSSLSGSDQLTPSDSKNAPDETPVAGEAIIPAEVKQENLVEENPLDETRVSDPLRRPNQDSCSHVTIGGHKLIAKIGEGGMGIVYKARDAKLKRVVALKMLLGASMGDEKAPIRFLAEAEAVAAIAHPHVVQVYECGEHESKPYISLEYCSGGTLADRLKKGRLQPRTAAELVQKITTGVAAVHKHGIVHRDLKPGNVLFDGNGEPRVADFGLAKRDISADLTQTGVALGTPAYMAPEQLTSKSHFISPLVDIWALGVILYECLTGSKPFIAGSLDSLYRQVLTDNPKSTRRSEHSTPRELDFIVLKCLEKDPQDRYQSADALAADLGHYLAGEPLSARAPGWIERSVKWARRKPTSVTAYALTGLSFILIGLVSGAVWLWQRAEAEQVRLGIARQDAETVHQIAEAARQDAEISLHRESQLREDLDRSTYLNRTNLAYREWQEGNLIRAKQLLEASPPNQRGWEWRYVQRILDTSRCTFKKHTAIARAADLSPNGHKAISADDDGRIFLWDAKVNSEPIELRGHIGGVWDSIFSPDGASVATCGIDGTVRLWDVATGAAVWKADAHTGSVNGVAFSSDGKQLVSIAGNITLSVFDFPGRGKPPQNEAKIWNAHTGQEIRLFPLQGAAPTRAC